jgi:hypothetical protein
MQSLAPWVVIKSCPPYKVFRVSSTDSGICLTIRNVAWKLIGIEPIESWPSSLGRDSTRKSRVWPNAPQKAETRLEGSTSRTFSEFHVIWKSVSTRTREACGERFPGVVGSNRGREECRCRVTAWTHSHRSSWRGPDPRSRTGPAGADDVALSQCHRDSPINPC